jgi:hypothetical protein
VTHLPIDDDDQMATGTAVFGLEVLPAKDGDALLLHYGTTDQLRLALVDGGQAGVFDLTLAPRLRALLEDPATEKMDGHLVLRWAAVTHVDNDHVLGMRDLFTAIRDSEAFPVRPAALFLNYPHDGHDPVELPDADQSVLSADEVRAVADHLLDIEVDGPGILGAEGYPEARALIELARVDPPVVLNPPDDGYLLAGRQLDPNVVGPLAIHVVSPTVETLRALYREWPADEVPVVDRYRPEKRLPNLSSIVLLVTHGADGRSMLLCGDTLGSVDEERYPNRWAETVVSGLHHLLGEDDAPFHFDLLKLPHHGPLTHGEDRIPRRAPQRGHRRRRPLPRSGRFELHRPARRRGARRLSRSLDWRLLETAKAVYSRKVVAFGRRRGSAAAVGEGCRAALIVAICSSVSPAMTVAAAACR